MKVPHCGEAQAVVLGGAASILVTHVLNFEANCKEIRKMKKTRSNGTLHTSAKTRLTILICMQIHDLDRHQNIIICSLANLP